MKTLLLTAVAAGLLATAAHADERPDHFEGKASETLEQAMSNFTATNRELAELLAQDELSDEDLGSIHELSYTLENALARIDAEVEAMAVDLEEVHLGSESLDRERVHTHGSAYLEAAQPLAP
ncbi:DUF6746 family protein [Halomonas ramblicola]|uniref:DUF6746 family protein n=1 Tax=Halomonas ramblicola TaxID=747349 RepID=UPI0025B34D44|nr:DUF6746 family protein [Halomonas ramblicola]MDN3523094.1 hypothetical protein [Halomonas ramblicola]